MLQTYYFTFGQTHTCPETGLALKDYWVEIAAKSEKKARERMLSLFDTRWAMQYHEREFMKFRKMFPKGCYIRVEVD